MPIKLDVNAGIERFWGLWSAASARLPGMLAVTHVAVVVRDYDEAIAHYCDALGMEVVEDTPVGEGKRWVVVAPPGGAGAALLLAQASSEPQLERVGDQTGGRVFLFLHTDDFAATHERMLAAGVIAAFGGALFETKRADGSAAWIARQCRKITGGLGEIQRVVQGRRFAVGDRLTQADIALGCIIGLFEFVSADFTVDIAEFRWRTTHPGLVPYIEGLEARSSFQATRPQSFGDMPFDRLMA